MKRDLAGVLVMQYSLIVENGYFCLFLKNICRISFLKRLTNTAKIAMKRLSKSIMDSLCVIPPLSLKSPKKNLALKLGSHIRLQQRILSNPFITMDKHILTQKGQI